MDNTQKAKEFLSTIKDNNNLATYGYDKIKELDLFIPLKNEGAFNSNSIQEPEKKKDRILYPYWPPIIYLEYIASEIQKSPNCANDDFVQKFLEVIKKTLESDKVSGKILNIKITYHIMSCIAKIPIRFIDKKMINLIFEILERYPSNGPIFRPYIFLQESIKEILNNIETTEGDKKKFQCYLEKSFIIVKLNSTGESFRFFSKSYPMGKDHLFSIEKEIIYNNLKQNKKIFILNTIVELFEKLLKNALLSNQHLDKTSRLWRPIIEAQDQIEPTYSPYSTYVNFIYKAALEIYKEKKDIHQNIKDWIRSRETLFKRIGIMLSARIDNFQENEYAEMIISLGVKRWREYKYEIFHFFAAKFKTLTKDLQSQVLDQIELIQANRSDNKEIIESNEKNGWLQALKNSANDRAIKMYQQTLSIIQEDTPFSDSNHKIEIWSGERCPWSLEEFAQKSYKEILTILQSFEETDFLGKTKRGLGEVFQQYILYNPESTHFFVENIKNIPIEYLSCLINSISTLWKNKNDSSYGDLLFSMDLLLNEENIKKKITDDDQEIIPAILSLLRFIQDGTEEDSYAFDKDKNITCHNIIIKLSKIIKPRGRYGIGEDAWTRAINEPRGVLFESAIILALRQARVDSSTKKAWERLINLIEDPINKQDIDEVSLHTLMGHYYRNLLYLNKKWFFSKLDILAPIHIPTKKSLGRAFMDGFSHVYRYNSEMYRLLYEKNILLSYMRYESNRDKDNLLSYHTMECRVIDLALVAYFVEDETLNSGIIKKIIDGKITIEWRSLIYSMARFKELNTRDLKKIASLLNKLIAIFNDPSSQIKEEHLHGIDRILTLNYLPTEDIVKNIFTTISNFSEANICHSLFVFDYLLKHKDSHAKIIGNFLLEILETPKISLQFSPLEFSMDKIISICESLKDNNETKIIVAKIYSICEKVTPLHHKLSELKALL